MDIRLWSVVISASVAIIIAVANHFIIEPIKERRRWKKQQLTNLYYPVYALLCARIIPTKELSLQKGRIVIGNNDLYSFLDRESLHEIILKNAGFASNEFLEAWTEYIASFPSPTIECSNKMVKTLVKDFNRLKKELGKDYNQNELKTGIPEVLKELRGKPLA